MRPSLIAAAADALGLERHAEAEGVRLHEVDVAGRACLGAGEDPDLERVAGVVERARPLRQRARHRLRDAGVGEAAEAQGRAVRDQFGRLLGGHHGEGTHLAVITSPGSPEAASQRTR